MPRGTAKTPKPTTESAAEGSMSGNTTTAIMDPAVDQWASTPTKQPLNGEMESLVSGPSSQFEGAPYYDPTLNFLHWRYEQVELDNMRALDKIDKLEMHSRNCQREMATIAALLRREFEAKEVINPNTGERIDTPSETYVSG